MASAASVHSSDEGRVQEGNGKTYTRAQIVEATQAAQTDRALFAHREGVVRNFSLFSIIGLAYTCLNSWTAMAASLSLSISSGGPSVVTWGTIVALLGNLAMAVSMAEICSVYPTSGGQFHWVAAMSPASQAPALSYISGWLSVTGWIALTATGPSLAATLILGAYSLAHPEYESKPYQTFVVYLGYALIAMGLNIFTPRILPYLDRAALVWSLLGATVILIVALSVASPNFQPGSFVFTDFINETGWSDGVAWILGLLQASFGLIAYDGAAHMIEEMPRPHRNAPIAMVLSVIIGSISSFIFLFVLLFCIKDVDSVISSSAGALIESIFQATGSVAGTICLAVFPILSMFFTSQALLTASSRMTHAFARDGGIPFSRFFDFTNPKTGVPDRSVILNTVLVIVFGLIYLGSSSAFNAILSTSVVVLSVSYCVPVIILLVRGRRVLRPASFPAPRWSLGKFGVPINIFACTYMLVLTVFFLFPPELPVTGSNMNYCIAVCGIIAIVATVYWFAQGRKTFTGPKDLGALLELARAEMEIDYQERKAARKAAANGATVVANEKEAAKQA